MIFNAFRPTTNRLGLALLLGLQVGAAQAAALYDAGLSYSYNDNLSNGELASDIKGDQAAEFTLAGGQFIQLNRDLGLIITAAGSVTAYDTYSGLNQTTLGVNATLRQKFGLGPMAPQLRVRLDANHLNSHHDPRDRWIFKAGLELRKRVQERLELRLDWERLETEPDSRDAGIPFLITNFGIGADVWDIGRSSLTATAVVNLSERLSAYGRYSRQDGTIVSSTRPDPSRLSVYEEATFDPVFGPGVVAYAIDATTDIASIGGSWALNRNSSVNLGFERRESEGGAGFKYDNTLTHISLLVAF